MVSAPSRRELVRHMTTRGLSERRSLQVIGMSASSFRYQTAPDRNEYLREQIVTLAQRHRRYAGMIYLKLRQSALQVNHKRVERLYAEARLQVRRRHRYPARPPDGLGRLLRLFHRPRWLCLGGCA